MPGRKFQHDYPFYCNSPLKMSMIEFPISLYYIVPVTTFVWLVVTYLTKPTEEKTLIEFYTKIHPGGILWKKFSLKLPDVQGDKGFFRMFMNWFFGVVLVYSILFRTGSLIFGDIVSTLIYSAAAIISITIIYINLKYWGWTKLVN
jgi:solute:Na+ symporter, SSS family